MSHLVGLGVAASTSIDTRSCCYTTTASCFPNPCDLYLNYMFFSCYLRRKCSWCNFPKSVDPPLLCRPVESAHEAVWYAPSPLQERRKFYLLGSATTICLQTRRTICLPNMSFLFQHLYSLRLQVSRKLVDPTLCSVKKDSRDASGRWFDRRHQDKTAISIMCRLPHERSNLPACIRYA